MPETMIRPPAQAEGERLSPKNGLNVVVVPAPAESSLLARLAELRQAKPGMHLSLIKVSGFEATAWKKDSALSLVAAVLRKQIPVHSIGEVYGLSDDRLALLVLDMESRALPPVEEMLVRQVQSAPGNAVVERYLLAERWDDAFQAIRKIRDAVVIEQSDASACGG